MCIFSWTKMLLVIGTSRSDFPFEPTAKVEVILLSKEQYEVHRSNGAQNLRF